MRENLRWIKMFSVIKDKISTAFTVLWQSVKSFIKNDNSSAAASLAYYSLFALIPLLLLLFFALSFFITSSKAIMQRLPCLSASSSLITAIPYLMRFTLWQGIRACGR